MMTTEKSMAASESTQLCIASVKDVDLIASPGPRDNQVPKLKKLNYNYLKIISEPR